MLQLDTSTEFGARVERRLNEDQVIWLTTVGSSGMPASVPVWFLWDGATILIYSRPDTPKLRHIQRSPKVQLNFNSDSSGGDVIRIEGSAAVDDATPPATGVPEFVEKYHAAIERLGTTPEGFAGAFSTPVRVTPSRGRGH
jgi:PPOX class probable F420-dependent enzyme